MRELRSIGLAATLLLSSGFVHAIRAAEVCVVCTGPDVMYRCIIDASFPDITPAANLLCISHVAADGKHETCGVSRTVGMEACNGPERHVKPGSFKSPPGAPLPLAPQPPSEPPKELPRKASEATEGPATVQDLARQITKSTGEQVEKAGSAISGAARKTWGCVSSFFKAC